MEYAVKIGEKYFKEYIYMDEVNPSRFAGITALGTRFQDRDIIDVITTEKPERTEVRRSIGGTISTLLSIDKIKDKKIEIIPLEG